MGKAALIVVLGTSMIVSSMLISINDRTALQADTITDHYRALIAKNIASSAANMAAAKLYRDFTWRTGMDTTSFNQGNFRVQVQDVPFDTSLSIEQVRVAAFSDYGDLQDTVEVILARDAFSKFGMFAGQWDSNLYWATGDVVYGPVHTNQRFGFMGTPKFYGKVTQVAPTPKLLDGADPQFLGGHEWDVSPIPMPDYASGLQALVDSANSGGLYLTGEDAYITFYNDGTIDYRYASQNDDDASTISLASLNGSIVIQGGHDLHVKGTVHGQLTVFCDNDIYLDDDLVYKTDPRSDATAQDMLGLIALNEIYLADTPENKGNAEAHAALMAINGSLKIENLGSITDQGDFTTLGSIVQKNISAYSIGGVGYDTVIYYDERFLHTGPPIYPITGRISRYSWVE